MSALRSLRCLLLAAVCPAVGSPIMSAAAEATPAADERVLLTPPAPATPRINGPRVLGVHPGRPFLYRIPATGERPMLFTAKNLPSGLRLDVATGIITGMPTATGKTTVTLTAQNAKGSDARDLQIVVGDTLALTPPMGWNSWYIHYNG